VNVARGPERNKLASIAKPAAGQNISLRCVIKKIRKSLIFPWFPAASGAMVGA
jgi:hypothetical protein